MPDAARRRGGGLVARPPSPGGDPAPRNAYRRVRGAWNQSSRCRTYRLQTEPLVRRRTVRARAQLRACGMSPLDFLAMRREPRLEVDRPDARAVARRQLAAVQLGAVVTRVWVADDLTLVAGGGEQAPRPRVDAQRLRPAELDAAADRRAGRQLGHAGGHVVGADELHQPGRQPDAVALGTTLDDLGQELEELRGPQDGVRVPASLDLGLLGDLGAQVAAVGQAVGPDDRHRKVVADAGVALGRHLVARRGG